MLATLLHPFSSLETSTSVWMLWVWSRWMSVPSGVDDAYLPGTLKRIDPVFAFPQTASVHICRRPNCEERQQQWSGENHLWGKRQWSPGNYNNNNNNSGTVVVLKCCVDLICRCCCTLRKSSSLTCIRRSSGRTTAEQWVHYLILSAAMKAKWTNWDFNNLKKKKHTP